MVQGLYQGYSGERKEKGKTGFVRILVADLAKGTYFSVREGANIIDIFTSDKKGVRALGEFRTNSDRRVSLDWMRIVTESTYKKRSQKSI